MATDPISAGLGVAGLIMHQDQARRAENNTNDALKGQDRIIDEQINFVRMLKAIADDASAKGLFDPTTALGLLDNDIKKAQGLEMNNLAAAYATAGGRPGDGVLDKKLDTIALKYRDAYARTANDIRRQSLFDKIQAYSAANPGMLNGAMQVYGQRAQMSQAQAAQQNPASFFMSVLPFLQNNNNGGKAPVKTSATVNTGAFNNSGYGSGNYGGGSIWGQGFGGGMAGGGGFSWERM